MRRSHDDTRLVANELETAAILVEQRLFEEHDIVVVCAAGEKVLRTLEYEVPSQMAQTQDCSS